MPTPSTGRTGMPTVPADIDLAEVRRARNGRRVFLALIALAVVAGLSSYLGPHSSTVSASGGGYRLSLTYPRVTRPGLAIRWILRVSHRGGFGRPIDVDTNSDYFNLFDFNNLDPVPSAQTTGATNSVWTFDPPPGDVLQVTMDARVEPAQQHGRSATTGLRIHGSGTPLVQVHYVTTVLP